MDSEVAVNNEIQAIYPANSLQQGFIFHAVSQPSDDAYLVQTLFDYTQEIDIDAYKRAWALAIKTYPSLRLCFNWDESPIQIITKHGHLHFTLLDITTETDKNAAILKLQKSDRALRFDLTKPSLLRLQLIKQSNNHYTLLKTEHHSIADAWSAAVLLNQVHHFYHELIFAITPEIIQDNAYLQAQAFITKQQTQAQEHWKKAIQDNHQANDLNALFTQHATPDALNHVKKAREINIELDPIHYERLNKLVHDEGLTLHGLIQFSWHKILHTYTQDAQTMVGTTVSGRTLPIANIEKSVGLYINTLPLIVHWNNEHTIKQQLHAIHEAIMGLNKYSFVNLAALQQNGNRLFNSLLLFENLSFSVEKPASDTDLNAVNRHSVQKLNYPLALTCHVKNNTLCINFKYDGIYLSDARANQLVKEILIILQQIPCKLHLPHHNIDLLSSEELQQILHTWNATNAAYPDNKTLADMFEIQVQRTPNAIALIFEEQKLTYRELDTQANQLAHFLHEKGLHQGELVALCLDRSLELLISILGVLKAGCAYVPIDPAYPLDRIKYVLKDTESRFLLTQSQRSSLFEADINCVIMDQRPYQQASFERLVIPHLASDLAYVIYTSGTTGNPKGVAITHKSTVNRLHWMQSTYPLNERDTVLQKTPYGFDVSVWELFWANWTGAKIVMARPDGHKDPHYLQKLIQKENVTVLHFVPSMLSAFTEALTSFKMRAPDSLRFVFCSGEALLANQVAAFYAVSGDAVSIHNLYGPTEASIDVTAFSCDRGLETIYIGRPIQNTRIYLLNAHLKPVPIGAIGDLYLGGAGLAREYWRQPELTTAAFIHNPFATEDDLACGYSRLYKTGDRARWLPDGNLDYLGRMDSQVKIRGFRIELSEIEQVMLTFSGVSQAAALIKEHITPDQTNRFIAAYYVGNVTENSLQTHLAKHLPDYMLPTALIALENFPVTRNGKLDRNALPLPAFMIDAMPEITAPRNALEKKLCATWKEILKVPQVNITDNFFELGGDSIRSIHLVAKMHEIGFYVSVNDIFKYKTIVKLVEQTNHTVTLIQENYVNFSLIDNDTKNIFGSDNAAIEDIYPAGYLQMGMLVESLKTKADGAYHDVFTYTINHPFNEERLLTLFNMLIVKHPLLRTAFFEHPDYGYICVQYKTIDIISHYNGISEKKISDFIQIEKNRQFAIDQPGLFRLFVLNVTDNKFVLVFSFHHAITDGWSMASLISAFTSAYSNGNEIAVEAIPPYQRIIKQECDALLSSQFDKFWRDYLADAPSPADNFRFHPETITDKNIEIGCLMEDTKSRDILLAAKRLGVSPDCIFLASYFKTLSRFCNQSDLVIGLVMNNRLEEMNGDKVFGLHLNTLPLRVLVGNNSAQLTDVLSQQKTELNTYKAYPYSKIRRDILSGNDIYTCAFNYIHFHVMDAQLNSLDTIDIFEKTTIPFTLHVSRHHDRFRISIKALNEFIDHETATYILDYLQHDLHAIIHDLEFSWLSKNDPKYFINWNKKTGIALPKSKPLAEMQQPRNALEKSLCDIWKTVLNISRIGITDNFFELGGDSIRSIRILAKMQEIGFYVSVNDIFKHKTILALIENTNHTVSTTHEEYAPFSLIDNATRTTILVSKKENSIEDIYPASYLQMGMLIESLKAEAEGTYHDVFAYTIHRPFNEGLLLYIFKTLSVKHPLLRTGFLQHADYGYVCVQHADIDISLHYSGIIQENVVNFIKAEKNNPLEINRPGLFRLFVLNTNESEFTLLFSSHHAIMDGWSVASLISEFTAAYAEGKFIAMEKIPLYQRVIQQERLALSSSEFENFWRDYLTDSPQPKRHLIFHPKALVDKNIDMNSALDNTTSAHILSAAKRFSVSPDIIFLTAYFKTLSRFFNQDNLIVGLVMNNRLEEEGGDKVFGLHLNTLPFRMKMIKNSAQLTTQLYEQKTRLNTYKAYPYGKIRTDIMQGADLYTCAFNYIHFHVVAEQLDAKNISPTQVFEKTNIPFTLHVSRHQDIFRITIKALNGFTDHETARYLLDYMEHDLHAIIHDLEFTWLSKDDPENFRNWNIITDTILPKSQIMTEMRQPRNALEKTLCDIWQNVLNVPRIGITDNFFELGGDSIRSIRLLAKMQEIGFHVSVSDIFKYKTILELLEHSNHTVALKSETYTHFSLIDDATSESIKTKNPSIQDIYPASYLQIHMLTDSLKTNAQGTYHDVFAYTIHRSFNEGLLLYIFKMLSVKHPLLRTAFMPNADYGYISAQHEEINIALHYKGIIEENSIDFINGEKNNLITIDQPGLFRLFVLNPMRDQFVLVFSFHHAITDGWSVASLMSEFTAAYASGKFIVMESIPLYQRVIQQERLALTSETHKAFWHDYLADALPMNNSDTMHRDLEISCVLDSEKSARVLSIAKRLGVSVDIVFLAAYFKTLSQHFNQKNPVIGLVMNNRLEETGGDKVFGLHLNILPLRMPLNISDNDDFILALADERLRLVPHKAYPYEKLCLDLNAPTGFYNFAFNYTHFHINENQTKDKLIDPIYVFEKMSIPLILQISRYQESFRLIIRTNAQFIDEKIAKNMLDFMLDQL